MDSSSSSHEKSLAYSRPSVSHRRRELRCWKTHGSKKCWKLWNSHHLHYVLTSSKDDDNLSDSATGIYEPRPEELVPSLYTSVRFARFQYYRSYKNNNESFHVHQMLTNIQQASAEKRQWT